MKSDYEKYLKYFSNVEHQVISQVTKSEIKTQLASEETKKRNIFKG